MASPSKTQFLNDVHSLLARRYKLDTRDRLPVLDAVIYGICHEGTTREQANQALGRFRDKFFDWNEVRVSSIGEIQDTLAGLPDPEGKAHRVRKFLRQLFERTYEFSLDSLTKKPQKDAIKVLHDYEVFGLDYVQATVIQQALGGHAIPVDAPMLRCLIRLGVAEPDTDEVALRGVLERAVPKNRGTEFVDLLAELAHDTCVEGTPDCPRCELRKCCPTGLERATGARSATKGKSKDKQGVSTTATVNESTLTTKKSRSRNDSEKLPDESPNKSPRGRTPRPK